MDDDILIRTTNICRVTICSTCDRLMSKGDKVQIQLLLQQKNICAHINFVCLPCPDGTTVSQLCDTAIRLHYGPLHFWFGRRYLETDRCLDDFRNSTLRGVTKYSGGSPHEQVERRLDEIQGRLDEILVALRPSIRKVQRPFKLRTWPQSQRL